MIPPQTVSRTQASQMSQYPLNAPYQPQPIDPYAGHTSQSQPPFPGASHYQNYPQQQTAPGSQIDMNRSWACQHCTYLNPDTNSICEQCHKSPNFNPGMPTEVSTARSSMAIKYCDTCHHPNRMQDVRCTKCQSYIIHSCILLNIVHIKPDNVGDWWPCDEPLILQVGIPGLKLGDL